MSLPPLLALPAHVAVVEPPQVIAVAADSQPTPAVAAAAAPASAGGDDASDSELDAPGGLASELLLDSAAHALGSHRARATMAALFRRATLLPTARRLCAAALAPPPTIFAGASRPVSALIAVFDKGAAAPPALPIRTGLPLPRRLAPGLPVLARVGREPAAAAAVAGVRTPLLAAPSVNRFSGGGDTGGSGGFARPGGVRLPGLASISGSSTCSSSSRSGGSRAADGGVGSPLLAPLPMPASVSPPALAAPLPLDSALVAATPPALAVVADAAFAPALPSAGLLAVLDFVPAAELPRLALVCREWRAACTAASSWRNASGVQDPAFAAALPAALLELRGGGSGALAALRLPVYTSLAPLLRAFPWARFLSEGAYKRVWRVWHAATACEEAISVMDVGALALTGNLPVVATEIQVGCMLSELVRSGACPNFVETRQVFLHARAPHVHFAGLWGGGGGAEAPHGAAPPFSAAMPTLASLRQLGSACGDAAQRLLSAVDAATAASAAAEQPPAGIYQFIRMELCTGDLESALREEEPAAAAAEAAGGKVAAAADAAAAAAAAAALFQLAFALYAARERFALRHHDVKLLNVFRARAPQGVAALRYHLGSGCIADVPLGGAATAPAAFVVKLADFGTAEVRAETLGAPVRPYHLTTLENAAPELLLHGSACTQSYATADTWALGLAALHLLTGAAPYEELLADLHCPPPLRRELRRLWVADAGFDVLWPALQPAAAGGSGATLADTLYRVLVLTADAPPLPGGQTHADARHGGGALCALLADIVGSSSSRSSSSVGSHRLSAAAIASLRRGFAEHTAVYNLWRGSLPHLQRARRRMALLPGAAEALAGLLALRPHDRPPMLTLLRAPLFDRLRAAAAAAPAEASPSRHVQHAVAYASVDAAAMAAI